MVKIRKSDKNDIEELMALRLEMLRVVNDMDEDEKFSDELVKSSREYFLNGDQTSVFAEVYDDSTGTSQIAGCASISYITIMPTFSHPTGKRAHLMNVYTRDAFRRRGIGAKMVTFLIEEAKSQGATEISLDATEAGRPLYQSLGFTANGEGMVLELKNAE
jgi:ribosomal protein S18 acetylase RimI-like enzyme